MLREDQAVGLTHVHERSRLRKQIACHVAFAGLSNFLTLKKIRGLALERWDSRSLVLGVSSHDTPLTKSLFCASALEPHCTRAHMNIRACSSFGVQ